jgi:hypothetical protein
MAEKLMLTVTAEGELLIAPGPAFGDEDVDLMANVVGAVHDVVSSMTWEK